ncbi:MAG: M20/M25/M40 family metallo-hydrolase [Myxococcales bacterium]|nr:M20/M25/M40 family metallo-hydrolase [Myxococcales bacterium]
MSAPSSRWLRSPWLVLPLLLGCGRKEAAAPGAIPPMPPAALLADAPDEAEDDDFLDDEDDGDALGPVELDAWMQDAARQITAHADGKTRAWERLAYVADRFGPRLSGSRALEDTIDWAVETMAKDGLSNARREKVMVPHWVRGKESLRILGPRGRELRMLGLGMSVGTKGPLRGELVVVENLSMLEAGEVDVAGKIVLINQRMPPYDHERNDPGYGEAVPARTRGASAAARRGAKAVLVRSVTATSLDSPHTGALRYEDGVPKIPAAAVTVEGAELLQREAARGPVKLELRMGAKLLPDVPSANAVAELRGRERPEEIVLIGGHIDSWDVGDGSSDDGAGCLMAMEAALMLHELGLVPRRTIRVVLFTNEENGLRGATAYHEAHGHEVHVAAIEADTGSGEPRGVGIASEDDAVVGELSQWSPLFSGLGATALGKGWGGADISPLMEDGVLGLSVRPDIEHYFDLHHSPADTIDKIDPTHLQRNAAVMALMAYLLAERE